MTGSDHALTKCTRLRVVGLRLVGNLVNSNLFCYAAVVDGRGNIRDGSSGAGARLGT